MLIHKPRITEEDNSIILSAKVGFENNSRNLPDTLWYKFPLGHKDYISGRADAFVAALTFLAMYLGEDIMVEGELSPKLAFNLEQFQGYFNFHFPKLFKKVKIKCANLVPQEQSGIKKGVVCAFSGGVDSFYTLYSNLAQNQPIKEYQITHLLFIHGFDIPLKQNAVFESWKDKYKELASAIGIEFLEVKNNIRDFVGDLDWRIIHAAALVGAVQALGKGISCLFFSAAESYFYSSVCGSNPVPNLLLSSETLDVVYYGADKSRVDKIKILSNWPQTYERLRVCWEQPDNMNNCCRCEKCLRTMISLELCGAISKYSTFPVPLKKRYILGWNLRSESDLFFAREVLAYAISLKNPLWLLMIYPIMLGQTMVFLKKFRFIVILVNFFRGKRNESRIRK